MDRQLETVKKTLTELGYFKYVEAANLDAVIKQTFEGYNNDGVINFPWEGLNRTFGIDAESIYEAGGIKDQIEGMLPFFKAIGLDIHIGVDVETFDNNTSTYIKRCIELNGIVYDASGASDWGTAFNSGFKMADDILKDHKKDENVYGLFMDETSTIIILDQAQYDYLIALIPEGSAYRPLDIMKMIKEHYGE